MRRTSAVLVLVVVMLLASTATTHARPMEGGYTTICWHRIRPGEILLCIAQAYGVRWQALAAHNGLLGNPSRIFAGQWLRIPDAPGVNSPGPVCARQCGGGSGPGCACRWNHTVVAGQNLLRISQSNGVNMWRIARCNGILNLSRIYAGQTLCIP